MKICGAILLVIVILSAAGFWRGRMRVLVLAGAILCFALGAAAELAAGSNQIEALQRNAGGQGDYDKELIAKTNDGDEIKISVTVPENDYTAAQIEEVFKEETERLKERILGENTSFSYICCDMTLPQSGINSDVSISWYSSDEAVISSSGEIREDISDEGLEVLLTAILTLQDEEYEYEQSIVVYPKSAEADIKSELQSEIERLNEENTGDEYILPQSLGDDQIIWYESPGNTFIVISLLVLVAGVLLKLNEKQKKEEKIKKRNDILKKEYSELISRLLLMLYSGTGVRMAFFRMAALYNRSKGEGEKRREVFEELTMACREMENGSSEDEAYERLAERCALPCYRKLGVLLVQNRKKGGKGFTDALEQEVMASFAERRRLAEIAGNTASMKLLLPLGMMLMVVLALMMIPAFMSI